MRSAGVRLTVFTVLCASAAIGASLVGRAQPSAGAPDVLTALLVEVRGLRAALELMASAGPRVQLALGRVQLQEQRIANQVRRLDSVRSSLVSVQRDLEPLERELKDFEDAVRRGGPPPEDDLEFLKQKRAHVARQRAEVQRLTAEETLLTQDIAGEQSRWTDFNQRLEELERALGRR